MWMLRAIVAYMEDRNKQRAKKAKSARRR